MKSEVVACLGYDAEVRARGTDEVRYMLAELEADHSKGKLQYNTTCSVDVTMPPGRPFLTSSICSETRTSSNWCESPQCFRLTVMATSLRLDLAASSSARA